MMFADVTLSRGILTLVTVTCHTVSCVTTSHAAAEEEMLGDWIKNVRTILTRRSEEVRTRGLIKDGTIYGEVFV